MPTIYIDNKPYKAPEGQNLLHTCLSLGFDIPYYCWHPAMHSVGACRMCAVKQFKDENDDKGKIVMSCMTFAGEGTRISLSDPEVLRFRKAVSEWLMTNHPHDCPICDEGGECHLQDMTLMTGQVYRRYRFGKRTYRNQYLGPFIRHEMNRCIHCYRCVRFYIDYAGGRDFDVFGWNNRIYFGRHKDGVLQSKFSGNLIEVCPTGVFTDNMFAKHFTRNWDLQTAPSICPHCGLGCNIIAGERYGTLRRIRNRYSREVNGYFICDRGRFGYEFVNDARRIRHPLIRIPEGGFEAASRSAVTGEIRGVLKDSERVIGIGSSRASLESNFALRALVGGENFYAGTYPAEAELVGLAAGILREGNVRSASLHDVELADAVLILGEDVSNVAPMLELALRRSILRKPSEIASALHIAPWNDAAVRQALQTEKGPLFIATTGPTDLDAAATRVYHAAPDDIARLGYATAHKLDPRAPAPAGMTEEVESLAGQIAAELKDARRPVIITGTSAGSSAVIKAAANAARALRAMNEHTQICFTMPACNSFGFGLMGAKALASATGVLESSAAATVIILENDLYRHLNIAEADRLLNAANNIIAIDCVATGTTERAHFVLPAATYAESCGTFVNNEGRAQRFLRVFNPADEVSDSWRWIGEMMGYKDGSTRTAWPNFDAIAAEMSRSMPIFEGVAGLAPGADFRIAGQRIARQPHRYSGRTAMHASKDVHEPKTATDKDSALAFSMEGYTGQAPAALITHYWAPGWNSVQSVNKFQTEIHEGLRGGEAGRRLIEPAKEPMSDYFAEAPAAFKRRSGYLLVVPAYHVFGSEELSVLAAGIAGLAAKGYIVVNPADAEYLKASDEGLVEVAVGGVSRFLPVRLSSSMPPGVARIPVGLAGLPWDGTPFWHRIADE